MLLYHLNDSLLYIPIWFYSNECKQLIENLKFDLYIPIWFYSNGSTFTSEKGVAVHFTFQSGSIQIYHINATSPNFGISFTFQSGSIQILFVNTHQS